MFLYTVMFISILYQEIVRSSGFLYVNYRVLRYCVLSLSKPCWAVWLVLMISLLAFNSLSKRQAPKITRIYRLSSIWSVRFCQYGKSSGRAWRIFIGGWYHAAVSLPSASLIRCWAQPNPAAASYDRSNSSCYQSSPPCPQPDLACCLQKQLSHG